MPAAVDNGPSKLTPDLRNLFPFARTEPGEVGAAPAYPEHYQKVAEEQDDLRHLYFLPAEYTKDTYVNNLASECPLIVFVNSRSGGRLGADLTLRFHRRLGRSQVFDLSKDKPDQVLKRLWANFDAADKAGDKAARKYQRRLRIVVAGGDGTIAWVLGVLQQLELDPMPPVGVIPMGTGNDLSRSFGWGPAFDMQWIKPHNHLRCTLQRMAVAEVESLDCWKIAVHLPSQELLPKFPYSLRPRHVVCAAGTPNRVAAVAEGMFWNYMSIGLDAKAAHGFHTLRDSNPYLTAGRLTNQLWYSVFSCTSGWFCCTKPLRSKVALQMQRAGSSEWEDVTLPDEVKALVVLNLQSYAGGRNLWGPMPEQEIKAGKQVLHRPSYNDGQLEVVCLTNGYHTGCIMATHGKLVHAQRLCQAAALRLQLKAQYVRPDGRPSHAYMQVDGEPWVQDVPSSKDSEPITVEISCKGSSKMLKNHAGLRPSRLDPKWVDHAPPREMSVMPPPPTS